MKRRTFLKRSLFASGIALTGTTAWSKEYLTVDQAKKILWGNETLSPVTIKLTEEQEEAIEDASDVRVRNLTIRAFKTQNGGWLILDQIIGKHENIDMAFALNPDGSVRGLEVLFYRESYGHEVINPKWRAQFHGKRHTEHLKLDKQIKNISGATLSCAHITSGINRITQTWQIVLRHL